MPAGPAGELSLGCVGKSLSIWKRPKMGRRGPREGGFTARSGPIDTEIGLDRVSLAGNPENQDEDVEAFGRRCAVGGRAGAEPGERALLSSLALCPLRQLL